MLNLFKKKDQTTKTRALSDEEKKKTLEDIITRKTAPYGKPFSKGDENIILSEKYRLSQDDAKFENNIIVTGGSSDDRLELIAKPNILRKYGSFIVVDPDAKMYQETAGAMRDVGYDVKVLDFTGTVEDANHFNPLFYLQTESEVRDFADGYLENREPREDDDEWKEAHRCILTFSILYLRFYKNKEADLKDLAKLISDLASNDGDALNTMLSEMPQATYSKYLDEFMIRTNEEARNIAFSTLSEELSKMLQDEKVCTALGDDTLNLLEPNNKRILYICIEETSRAEQILTVLCLVDAYNAKKKRGKEIFSNDGTVTDQEMFIVSDIMDYAYIPGFLTKLSTKRKYGISFMILVGSPTNNLTVRYPDLNSDYVYTSTFGVIVSYGTEWWNPEKYPYKDRYRKEQSCIPVSGENGPITIPVERDPITKCTVTYTAEHVSFIDKIYRAG